MSISSAPIPRQRTGRVWRAVGTWAAAAAVVLALGGLGSLSYTQQQEVGELKAEMEALVAQVEESEQRFLAQQALVYWIAQPDVTTVAMRATNIPPVLANFGPRQGEPRGLLMRSPNGESVLVAINLTPLPEYYSYQAWAWDSLGRPYSLGVFEVDERGYAQVLVDYPHHAGEIYVMTVSVEPAGGSATPSQQTVIVGVVESQ